MFSDPFKHLDEIEKKMEVRFTELNKKLDQVCDKLQKTIEALDRLNDTLKKNTP
jgi:hypothetical protein